jgi:Subtilase family
MSVGTRLRTLLICALAASPTAVWAATETQGDQSSNLEFWGAALFGVVIGWFIYYINRYRKSDLQISDITTLLGALGGGVVAAWKSPHAFSGYAIGIAAGFFAYFLMLIILVARSKNFTFDWFLDGRRQRPIEPFYIPDGTTVSARPAVAPRTTLTFATAAPVSPRTELVVKLRDSPNIGVLPTAPSGDPVTALPRLGDLLRTENISITPLFPTLSGSIASAIAAMPSKEGFAKTNLSHHKLFYSVRAKSERHEDLARKLRACGEVEAAYVKPWAVPPLGPNSRLAAAILPASTSFEPQQGYLNPAPAGVDARAAWTQPGGDGSGIGIIDVEGAWDFDHEDLVGKCTLAGGVPTPARDWRDHGTAVLGIVTARRDAIGVTGIASAATVSAYSEFDSPQTVQTSTAIVAATDKLQAGDILLLEMHRPGPRYNFEEREDQLGYIPVEWWEEDFLAIQYATAKGIIVVEAGGNGAESLDDPLYDKPGEGFSPAWKNPLRRQVDSGAILVGAGAPPPISNMPDYGPNCSRLDFSNYGTAVDAQGWGRNVVSTGYGDLQNGSEDQCYTATFSGTSSASPMIVGAVACLQGSRRAAGKRCLAPGEIRNLLRSSGTPQVDGPNGPASQRIGNRPDLKALLTASAAIV